MTDAIWWTLGITIIIVGAGLLWWTRGKLAEAGHALLTFVTARPWKFWAIVLISAGLAFTAYWLQVQAPEVDSSTRVQWWIIDWKSRYVLTGIGGLCAAASVIIPSSYAASEATAARAARDAAVEDSQRRTVTVNKVLKPLAGRLGEISGLDRRQQARKQHLRGSAEQIVLNGLASLFTQTQNQVRACLFSIAGDAPNRKLVPAGAFGRTDDQIRPFLEGTPEGDEALNALDQEQARFWSVNDPGEVPPGWTAAKKYKTYISVPVSTKDKLHGMLTVDSTNPDEFDSDTDVATVELLARLLAAALSGTD